MTNRVKRHVEQKYRQSPYSRVMQVQSPFEADAQLVSLCQEGIADAIVTEDGDVAVYCVAAKIPVDILYKLDLEKGGAEVINVEFLLRVSK